MRITITSVFVDDQHKARAFYTEKLGFQVKHEVPVGEKDLWLTVVSPQDPDGVELLLEPSGHPAVGPYRAALRADGIPATQFTVEDIQAEYERLTGLGVEFTTPPTDAGTVWIAVLDDTCGNYLQLVQAK